MTLLIQKLIFASTISHRFNHQATRAQLLPPAPSPKFAAWLRPGSEPHRSSPPVMDALVPCAAAPRDDTADPGFGRKRARVGEAGLVCASQGSAAAPVAGRGGESTLVTLDNLRTCKRSDPSPSSQPPQPPRFPWATSEQSIRMAAALRVRGHAPVKRRLRKGVQVASTSYRWRTSPSPAARHPLALPRQLHQPPVPGPLLQRLHRAHPPRALLPPQPRRPQPLRQPPLRHHPPAARPLRLPQRHRRSTSTPTPSPGSVKKIKTQSKKQNRKPELRKLRGEERAHPRGQDPTPLPTTVGCGVWTQNWRLELMAIGDRRTEPNCRRRRKSTPNDGPSRTSERSFAASVVRDGSLHCAKKFGRGRRTEGELENEEPKNRMKDSQEAAERGGLCKKNKKKTNETKD